MNGEIARWLLLDTGYWIALFNSRDAWHDSALRIHPRVTKCHVLVPWPCLYEFLGTRMTRRAETLERLRRALRSPGIERINDAPYREQALDDCLASANATGRRLSLVDIVLRSIAIDRNVRIHGVVTFNAADFADVCAERAIELLPESE